MPIQLKKPMVDKASPASRNQADKVENTSKNGNPAENPRKHMAMTRGRLYTASASRQSLSVLSNTPLTIYRHMP